MSLSGTNGNTPTPNEVLAHAVEKVKRESSNSSVTSAELAIALADTQARLHAANQKEVENLFHVLESPSLKITVSHRDRALEKLLSILGVD